MKRVYIFLILLLPLPPAVYAQQQATVMSRCGGVETVTIPSISDVDQDGMDDRLEQKLLQQFTPKIIQFSDESCPGPALNGTGDSNLIVCHIYPIPQQYTRSSSYDSILIHPVPLAAAHQLVPGLIWYYPKIKVNCAILYGQDCGALGHTADVEGFNFSLKYTGPDTIAGWMYDTVMSHWMGDTIQTVSHAGTLCQHVETRPMKSLYVSWGADSVYASPDKHGNYLTIGGCGSSVICNPGCGATKQLKHVKLVNLGEPGATMVSDLGNIYSAYVGNDPWATADFLDAQGGNAGAIRDKMLLSLSSTFINGHPLTAAEICPLYTRCYGQPGFAFSAISCAGTPYVFRSRVLTQSGTYRDTVADAHGCDSVIALTLTVLPRDTTSYSAAVCAGGSYFFHGQTLTAPGIYHDTLPDQHGCDSAVRLTLSVYPQSGSSQRVVTCGTAYTFGGQILSSSGVYVDTIGDIHGCDSIVRLTLVVDTPAVPVWSIGTDTVMAHTHPLLLSISPAGGTFSGSGVNGNLFYADSVVPGSYVITYDYTDPYGCTTSSTKAITVLAPAGIPESGQDMRVTLHPNPVSGPLTLEFNTSETNPPGVSVYDLAGHQVVIPSVHQRGRILLDCSVLISGVYLIRLDTGAMRSYKYFVKVD